MLSPGELDTVLLRSSYARIGPYVCTGRPQASRTDESPTCSINGARWLAGGACDVMNRCHGDRVHPATVHASNLGRHESLNSFICCWFYFIYLNGHKTTKHTIKHYTDIHIYSNIKYKTKLKARNLESWSKIWGATPIKIWGLKTPTLWPKVGRGGPKISQQ